MVVQCGQYTGMVDDDSDVVMVVEMCGSNGGLRCVLK